jgi:threonine/homoserine/homoserine lactone efflux protein
MTDQILVIVGVTLLIMISPGPDMIIVMRNTVIGGRAPGLVTSAGILAGNLVHITYCAVGIGWLISQSILAFTILKYAGAVYLIYLGLMSLHASGKAIDPGAPPPAVSSRTWFAQGFVNNILNPKGTLFYLGVFTMVITPETSLGTMLLLIAITMSISAGFWVFFVFTLDWPPIRKFIERSHKTVSRIFGGLLIFLGIRVALMQR